MNDPTAQIQSALDRFVAEQSRPLRVLEAGCGSLSNIRLGGNVHIVGIDVSAEALAQNATIHEGIQANLETFDLGDSEYDLIVCWDVLEHLAQPTNVVTKFLRAIKPGGLILLALRKVLLLRGLIAKYTPPSLHLLVPPAHLRPESLHRSGLRGVPLLLLLHPIVPFGLTTSAGQQQ